MATKIKDQATAERAALKLNEGIESAAPSEPNTPKEKTTSERLFPNFITDDGAVINRPIRTQDASLSGPLPVAATPEPAPQGQTPATVPPTAPTYIKPEDLVGKMARLKVDGVEQDVPAESLFKTNQLERHLNSQIMKVAQEAKALEEERIRLRSTPIPESPKGKQPEPVKKAPEIEALEARLAQMEQERQQERLLLIPQIQEAGIKRVEQMAKERLGTDDFRSYFEKIKDSAFAEMAKPEVATNPQARAYFDSDAYYFQKYQEMKLRDMISKPSAPVNSTAPILQNEQGSPVVINNNGRPVSIPSFESSGGVPSRTSPDASWQSTYQSLFAKAQASGQQSDWVALYRHKVQAPE